MSYSRKVYEEALEVLAKRRADAEDEQQRRHEEVLQKLPKLAELERQMAQSGLAVVKALGRGEDAQAFIAALAEQNLTAQKEREQLLVQAGYPADYLKPRYTCPVCRDKGFVEGRRCACHRQLLKSIAYQQLCEELPLGRSTFENFDLSYYPTAPNADGVSPARRMREIYDFCRQYAADFDTDSPNLFLLGATGLGKTHLSLAIAGVAVNKGFGVIYGSAQNLLRRLEREHFGKSEDDETLDALLDCDLLILDDLGTEFSSSFTQSCIYNIINTRLLKGLPTIVSTNLTPEELEQKYTQRITSRIIGNYVSLQFCGRDIRQISGY